DPDGGTSTSVDNATAVIDLDAGENITCTFTNIDPRPQTKAVIERFLHHRLTALLDNDPDQPRILRRFPGSLWGGSGGAGGTNSTPFNLAMSEADGRASFSTSLSQIASAMAGTDQAKQQRAMSLGSAALNERPGSAPYSGVDIWTEAHFTAFEDDIGNGNADGNFDILYVGADIPLTTNLLVGILGQFDWAEEHTKADGSSAEGNGWMVGPYLSARIDEHLFFDWRAAWGRSDNSVSPIGTYTDNFDTTRWLTTARLTGNWTSGNWRLTPSAAFKYGEETQDAYTDKNGIRITGQTASLGRIEFGPEFGYRWDLADGTLVEPQLALYGVWNFDNGGSFLVADTLVTPDDFTGRIEGGLLVQMPKGMSFRGTAAYDGVGSNDYEAVTGKIWLNLPLN
ncbi:MAG TPA: autotransporter outer membrane beta-barrel domain-containing protein, partial [Devosiaceae bacterium]|nr:autotransporter outer membrane beta-barrel domain-containing protein [Devosiaceae bacterium]